MENKVKNEEIVDTKEEEAKLNEEISVEELKESSKSRSKDERTGIAYIHSTSNNTMVHITDLSGNTISRISGGMVTKQDRLKANPTTAMFVAKRAAERAIDLNFRRLYVRIKGKTREGTGSGAQAAVKSLSKNGLEIISVLETTKFPRGGPKKKGGKRGRRV